MTTTASLSRLASSPPQPSIKSNLLYPRRLRSRGPHRLGRTPTPATTSRQTAASISKASSNIALSSLASRRCNPSSKTLWLDMRTLTARPGTSSKSSTPSRKRCQTSGMTRLRTIQPPSRRRPSGTILGSRTSCKVGPEMPTRTHPSAAITQGKH